MKLRGIPIKNIKLKGAKVEPVKKYRSASDAIAAKKRPKQTWRGAR